MLEHLCERPLIEKTGTDPASARRARLINQVERWFA
jgi:hypothetical protein